MRASGLRMRCFAAPLARFWIPRSPGPGSRLLVEVLHDRVSELAAAFAGERGNDKAFALPAQSFQQALGRHGALSGGDGVDLIEHHPARLAVERLVVLLELMH